MKLSFTFFLIWASFFVHAQNEIAFKNHVSVQAGRTSLGTGDLPAFNFEMSYHYQFTSLLFATARSGVAFHSGEPRFAPAVFPEHAFYTYGDLGLGLSLHKEKAWLRPFISAAFSTAYIEDVQVMGFHPLESGGVPPDTPNTSPSGVVQYHRTEEVVLGYAVHVGTNLKLSKAAFATGNLHFRNVGGHTMTGFGVGLGMRF